MKFPTTNARSVRGKTALINYFLFSKQIDILAITETWLRPHATAACIAEMSPFGYTFHHTQRIVRRGGGVGFLVSDHFNVNSLADNIQMLAVSDGLSDHHSHCWGYFLQNTNTAKAQCVLQTYT